MTTRKHADPVAAARAEIEANKRAAAQYAVPTEDNMQTQEVDVIKAMSSRIEAIRKADPTIRSDQHAMLKLAESRSEADQALWRAWKEGVVPASTVVKAIDPEKAIRKMSKRVDELMQYDPTIRSRESAIAKVAASTLEADQRLWQRYKAAGQAVDAGALLSSDVATAGKLSPSEHAFEQLVTALRDAYGISDMQARDWARRTQQHAPPQVARLTGQRP
jgi:hypothetical protein